MDKSDLVMYLLIIGVIVLGLTVHFQDQKIEELQAELNQTKQNTNFSDEEVLIPGDLESCRKQRAILFDELQNLKQEAKE